MKLKTRPIFQEYGITKQQLLEEFRQLVKSKYPDEIDQIYLNKEKAEKLCDKFP